MFSINENDLKLDTLIWPFAFVLQFALTTVLLGVCKVDSDFVGSFGLLHFLSELWDHLDIPIYMFAVINTIVTRGNQFITRKYLERAVQLIRWYKVQVLVTAKDPFATEEYIRIHSTNHYEKGGIKYFDDVGSQFVTLFTWFPHSDSANVGHVSLRLPSQKFWKDSAEYEKFQNFNYLSFWPGLTEDSENSGNNQLTTRMTRVTSLSADIAREHGRNPDFIVEIPPHMIDSVEVANYWRNQLSDGEGFNLVSKNCSKMVWDAMRSGGFGDKLPINEVAEDEMEFPGQLSALRLLTTNPESVAVKTMICMGFEVMKTAKIYKIAFGIWDYLFCLNILIQYNIVWELVSFLGNYFEFNFMSLSAYCKPVFMISVGAFFINGLRTFLKPPYNYSLFSFNQFNYVEQIANNYKYSWLPAMRLLLCTICVLKYEKYVG